MRDGVAGKAAETETGRPDAEERHRELVRLAYFVLPGRGKRPHRMAMARRIVECTGGMGGGYARRRTRVLRRAMRPSPLWRLGLRPWLRSTPTRMPAMATTSALAALDPPVRVAYVLLNVAGLTRYEVRDQLLDLRVPDQMDVIEEAERASVPVIRTWPHSDPFAPGRVKPLGRRSPVPVGVAVAVTVALVGALVVVEGKGRFLSGTSTAAAHGLSLVAAAPEAWRTAPHSLDVWPARGELAGDKQFTGRALKAWAEATGSGTAGSRGGKPRNPQLLFAGNVDGRKVALVRRGDRIGRFTGPNGPMSVSRVSTDPAAPVHVSRGRYLVAPWDQPSSLGGKKLTVRQGITDPVFPGTRCGRGPVMHLSEDGKARTVGEFGGTRGVPLKYRSPAYVARAKPKAKAKSSRAGRARTVARAAKAQARIGSRGLRIWEKSACVTPPPERPVSEATAWEFWSGTVPLGGGPARWVCTGMSYAGGGSAAQATLLDKRGARGTGRCDAKRPVSGSWWRSAHGDWYYLAAAARGRTPRAKGPFRSSMVRSRLLIAVPSEPKRRPSGKVTLASRRA